MIPQTIHFIWLNLGNPFPSLYENTLKAAVKNTSFKIILHTNDESLIFDGVETRVRVFTKSYNNHTFVFGKDCIAHLIDIARLEILLEEGGIYSDLDVFWLKNPWSLLHHSCFIGFDNKAYKILCNAVIGATPGHPAILAYKNWCIENYPAKKWWSLANPYKVWKDRSDVVFLEKKVFFPVRWTKMANVSFDDVKASTAIHLYKSFGLEFGGEFFDNLFTYLLSDKIDGGRSPGH
jgi:hypothetical protein